MVAVGGGAGGEAGEGSGVNSDGGDVSGVVSTQYSAQ